MSRIAVLLVAFLCVLALALAVQPAVFAKKPPKPPPPPPTDPDPAIAYRTTVRELWVANADGSNATRILQLSDAKLGRPDWSPPGWSPPTGWPQSELPYLVFWSDVQGPGIYVIRVDGEDLRKVTDTTAWGSTIASRPAWSPATVPGSGDDEYRIAYTDQVSASLDRELFIVSLDGTDKTRLTVNTEYEEFASWSPDAGKLVVNLIEPDGDRYGIYDLATGVYTLHQHAGPLLGRRMTTPEWAQTQADKIVWAGISSGDIWVVDLDTPASPLRLTDTGKITEGSPGWSPDDSKIVFMEKTTKGKSTVLKIAIANAADGSGHEVILDSGAHPAWRRE
jgi:Tol biopolymer transport system component